MFQTRRPLFWVSYLLNDPKSKARLLLKIAARLLKKAGELLSKSM
jgi:hypothetical protein